MLVVVSPAKNLDYQSPLATQLHSQPDFLQHSQQLVEALRELSAADLSQLMSISDKLGVLNHQRYVDWATPFSLDNARPAVLAFNGDVYAGLDAPSMDDEGFAFAQQHLRILSGLYGVLRPLDLMQAYRLEMGTRFAPNDADADNLYGFWGDAITDALNRQLAAIDSEWLLNCASNEYFKSVQPKRLDGNIITPVFKDEKNGQYKIISFYAKKARGLMARYVIDRRLTHPEQLHDFNVAGYQFEPEQSTGQQLVFYRSEASLQRQQAA